jgi:hypothetical protein
LSGLNLILLALNTCPTWRLTFPVDDGAVAVQRPAVVSNQIGTPDVELPATVVYTWPWSKTVIISSADTVVVDINIPNKLVPV